MRLRPWMLSMGLVAAPSVWLAPSLAIAQEVPEGSVVEPEAPATPTPPVTDPPAGRMYQSEEERRFDEQRAREDLYRTPYEPTPAAPPRYFLNMGASILLGGGVTNYAHSGMSDVSGLGGGWNAKLALGTHRFLALEAAYLGTASRIDALGLDGGATLVSNGVQGNLRFNLTRTWFQPYLFGGAAYKHYSLTNTDVNNSAVNDSDNVFEVPVGVGLAIRLGDHFVIEPRADYRFAFDDELLTSFDADGDANGDLGNWNISTNIGVDF